MTEWLSRDKQSNIDMGDMWPSEALAELLSQCGDDEDREAILDGTIIAEGKRQSCRDIAEGSSPPRPGATTGRANRR